MPFPFHPPSGARFLAALFLAVVRLPVAHACSTFCMEHEGARVFGRNYDWELGDGLVVVNPRGLQRTAATADHPASWTSRHGSVTFNQYGCGFPHGGMNEAGLVVEQMWLDETRYPEPDARPAVSELQWIQYQLDNCGSVAEVLASDRSIRIAPGGAPIHFLVADARGGCAAIEFLDGGMVAHTAEALPIRVLTNSTWSQSAAYAARFRGFGGSEPAPESRGSLDRFARTADRLLRPDAIPGRSPTDKAFHVLDQVAQGEFTQWQMVYDIAGRRIAFRTRREPGIRTIDVGTIDFACRGPASLLDIQTHGAGDVTRSFRPYSRERNRALVLRVYRNTSFTAHLPADVLESIARYPESATCAGSRE